jgi:metal-responsive CopG/Arc/MetJ family transcriptional regulator
MGRNPQCADASVIAAYFVEHRNELIREAWEHPVAQQYRQQERMRLARKALVAAIREKGQRVNSIAPEELNKLIQSYLKDHRWECAIREIGCS